MSADRQGHACAPNLPVPLDRVAAFVRSLSHDLRNTLSVVDLQAAYAAQLSSDSAVAAELAQIRTVVRDKAEKLRRLSAHLQPLRAEPIACLASALVDDFRARLETDFPSEAPAVQWSDASGTAELAVDLNLFRAALTELFRNAFHWLEPGGTIAAAAIVAEGRWVLELRETKTHVALPTASWGIEPFVSGPGGGHGIGLYQVRRIAAVHGGEITFVHSPERAELVTRLRLPVVATPAPALQPPR